MRIRLGVIAGLTMPPKNNGEAASNKNFVWDASLWRGSRSLNYLNMRQDRGETMEVRLLILVFLTMVGCSSRGVYEGIQAGNRFECSKLAPHQYDECMENANKSYEEYERERKEAMDR